MELQERKYLINDNSILLKEYKDVNKANNNLEYEMQNSLGSNAFQSMSKFPQNQENKNNTFTNSNMNYPVQNFENSANPMNASNGNGFQSFPNKFSKTDNITNQNYNMNGSQNNNQFAQTYQPGQGNYSKPEQNYQLTKESWEQLKKEVEKLYDYYYLTKGYFQNDPNELYNFYLDFRIRYDKGINIPKRLNNLMKYRDEDIDKCIDEFLKNVKDRFKTNLSSTTQNSRIKKCQSAKKSFDNTIKNTYKKTSYQNIVNNLYPKSLQKKNENVRNCDLTFDEFFKKIVISYYKKNKKFTNDINELVEHYKDLPNKEDKNMEWENGERDFVENIELFLNDSEMVTRLSNIYEKKTKLRTYHPTILHDYWQHFMSKEDKYLKGLYKYNNDDFYSLLEKIYLQKEDQKKFDKDNLYDEERNRQIQMKKDRQNHIRETEEEREKLINELAQPKDKYKTGRVMLELKKQFKYDNVIKKMIKNEFKDNKLFKFPEEYAIRDEEEEKDTFFKHDLNRDINNNFTHEEKIKKQIEDAYEKYHEEKEKKKPKLQKQFKEKKELFDFIKSKVIEYYKNMSKRLSKDEKGIESINLFLNNVYKEMSRKYKNATRIYFKHPRCEVLKKTYKVKKIHTFYPKKLKFYFFRLLRRIGINNKGKIVFAKNENVPFWSPSLSNKCKIHGNNCPIYCCYNTHNDMIKESREKNFDTNFNINKYKKKLVEKETLNLWKRPDLQNQKEQIFMCFDDAMHCTFEPKLSKQHLEKDDLIDSRLNNDKWVKEMGNNFTMVRATIYKEGILKKAKILFSQGKYTDCEKLLKKGFDLDVFKVYKPRFLLKEGETNKLFFGNKNNEEKKNDKDNEGDKKEEKKEGDKKEEKKEEKKEGEEKKDDKKINNIKMPGFRNNIDLSKPSENFKSEKNLQLLDEIYFMLETIKEYKKRQKSQSKKLKEELKLINHEKDISGKKIVKTKEIDSKEKFDPNKNIQYALMKQKYFNPKSKMCELQDNCPYYLKGEECPNGAHQISELKFESQINENIKLRKNLISTLDKAPEPIIKKPWVHTGRLISCGMADGSGGGKCICGFCKYRARNYDEGMEKKLRKMAREKNEKILKKREERIKKQKSEVKK